MQALDDVVVLDLAQHIAGPYATRLLADLGADVIKVEPSRGDLSRQLGPFARDEPHPEKSGLFFYLNCNKRSVVLDLKTEAGRRDLLALAARADLVVESFAPGTLDGLGLGWEELRRLRSDLSLLSISNFGQDGPYRDYKLTDLVLYGFAGEMYSMGFGDREPVKMAGTAALFESGSASATAALGALFSSRRHGVGQHVDISLAETHLGGCDRRHATTTAYQFSGRRTQRTGDSSLGLPGGIYACADGYVDFTAAGFRPDRVVDLLQGADWLADPRFGDPEELTVPEVRADWNSHFNEWCMARTKREIWAEARRARVLCGPLFTMQDLFEDEHFLGRGFWASIEHPELGRVTLPGRPFRLASGGWELRRPAPLLGQHTEEVLDELARSPAPRAPAPRPAVRRASGEAPRPLEGIRVLDFCVAWAGPFATLLLADLGAEVIKLENPFVWQPMTRGASARPDKQMLRHANAWGGGYPNNEPGERPWNYSPTFVSIYRNKKSFTVDLRRPEGLDVLAQLVAKSDVVYENNATGTLDKLGINYDWLRAAKSSIIFAQVPAYGSTGAYAEARALGVHLEGVMGHTMLRGYEDADPSTTSTIFSGDYFAGTQGALAVMAALRHRERTGEGQRIEMAQAENAAAMFTQAIMDYSLNGRVQRTIGNRDVQGRYPCGVYPARSAGTSETMDDHWIALHVESDEQWRAFGAAIGNPEWARNPRFASNEGRAEHAAELDAKLAAYTSLHDDYELMTRLQSAGLAAAPVLEASRVFDDPHLRARGFFHEQTVAGAGTHDYPGPLWKFGATPVEFRQPPVCFGEHNDYVYRELLGLSEQEIGKLTAAGHIADEYDESVP